MPTMRMAVLFYFLRICFASIKHLHTGTFKLNLLIVDFIEGLIGTVDFADAALYLRWELMKLTHC